jgi:hypothetical protein
MPDDGDIEDLEGTLESEVDGEHDDETPSVAGYLRAGEEYLGQLVESRGGGRDGTGLSGLRKAVKRTARLVEEAEQRGYARARSEFRDQALDDQTREQLRREFVEELHGQNAARRNALRLGIPDALLGNFEGLGPDFKDWERRAAELHAAGITWGEADPLLQQVAAARLQAAQHAAAQVKSNGGPVSLAPGNGVPEQVRDQLVAEATEAMVAGQAGGLPPHAPSLESDIRKAAQNPGAYSPEELEGLANRFNRELDGLAHYMGGGGPL